MRTPVTTRSAPGFTTIVTKYLRRTPSHLMLVEVASVSVPPVGRGGTPGGMSGTVMGPARHVTAASTVLMGGMPATRLTSMSMQNSTNVAGCRIAPAN